MGAAGIVNKPHFCFRGPPRPPARTRPPGVVGGEVAAQLGGVVPGIAVGTVTSAGFGAVRVLLVGEHLLVEPAADALAASTSRQTVGRRGAGCRQAGCSCWSKRGEVWSVSVAGSVGWRGSAGGSTTGSGTAHATASSSTCSKHYEHAGLGEVPPVRRVMVELGRATRGRLRAAVLTEGGSADVDGAVPVPCARRPCHTS